MKFAHALPRLLRFEPQSAEMNRLPRMYVLNKFMCLLPKVHIRVYAYTIFSFIQVGAKYRALPNSSRGSTTYLGAL